MIGRPAPEDYATPAVRSELFGELAHFLGNRITQSLPVRSQHGHSLSWLENQPPEAVAFPDSAAEVSKILKRCNGLRVPVVAFGAGTSLEAQLNAPFGGLCLDLSRMTAVKRISPGDLDCEVEPGLTRIKLNEALRDTGLFFSVDPGADASLGGMASTGASGTSSVRYGTMRNNVLSLDAVTASGDMLRTGTRARKSAAGYDLTQLILGSEGTLAIITALTLRLHGIPEVIRAAVCPFESLEGACKATALAMQLGLGLARIELLDRTQIKACNAHSRLGLSESPTLFLEFHGTAGTVREQSGQFSELALDYGGGPFNWAENADERSLLWRARHDAYWAARGLRPGAEPVITDVCVPISRLAECVTETHEDIVKLSLIAPIVGHAGDGNFHAVVLADLTSSEETARVRIFLDRLVSRAQRMEGTCTGEHGIGQGKIGYLAAQAGHGVPIMRAIKAALDPHHILNPGKIF